MTLVLLDAAGDPLGALPPYDLDCPYWPEAADVVAAARERYDVDVDVLRLLHADRPRQPGGHLTLLAQTRTQPALPSTHALPLAPVEVDLAGHPRRAPWAVPGGPARSVRWAVDTLAAAGQPGAVAVQQRTWNLSAIWRLDLGGAPAAWLKQVPPFFAHEPALLRVLGDAAPGFAPELLAAGDEGRALLAHVPGDDRYGADAGFRAAVAADWHPVQAGLAYRIDDLLAAGVPDRRSLLGSLLEVAEPYHHTIPGLSALTATLGERLAAVAACGLPDTLIHGDLHPGNVRETPTGRVIIDWGDATIAHPGYDILRLTDGLPPADAVPLFDAWASRWRDSVPGSDPERAIALLRPLAELRNARVYADFLAGIEPSEWPYHADDVPAGLTAAVDAEARLAAAGVTEAGVARAGTAAGIP